MVHRQTAMVFVERGDLDRALELAKRAVASDRAEGLSAGKSLCIEGIVRGLRKDFEGSVACFKKVLEIEDPEGDDYIFAANNLIASLLERPLLASEIVEARKTLGSIQERIRGLRKTPVRYFVWGVEGRLHASLAEFRQAANHFAQARSGFLRLQMIPDYARASIDFIDALVQKGDVAKARVVIERTAKEIAGSGGPPNFAEAFRLAAAVPIGEASKFLRSHIDRPRSAASATAASYA